MIDGRAPFQFPLERASDEELSVLAALLDGYPLLVGDVPEGWRRGVGRGASKLGDSVAYIFQAESYRKIFFKRDRRTPSASLIEIGRRIATLDEPAGLAIVDASAVDETDLAALSGHRPGTEELAAIDAEYFAEKYPFFSSYSGGALTDVLIEEVELGKPVFYGLVPRPERQTVLDITECIQNGDLVCGKDGGDCAYWLEYVVAAPIDRPEP